MIRHTEGLIRKSVSTLSAAVVLGPWRSAYDRPSKGSASKGPDGIPSGSSGASVCMRPEADAETLRAEHD